MEKLGGLHSLPSNKYILLVRTLSFLIAHTQVTAFGDDVLLPYGRKRVEGVMRQYHRRKGWLDGERKMALKVIKDQGFAPEGSRVSPLALPHAILFQ